MFGEWIIYGLIFGIVAIGVVDVGVKRRKQ
jgi:hypothetical protein